MPLTRKQKEEKLAQITQNIKDSSSAIFITYTGLNVDDMEELRDQLFAKGAKLRVVPKRLLNLAMTNLKLAFNPVEQTGQMAVAWGEDIVAPAKTLYDFSKDHETVQLIAGIMEGELIDAAQATTLAQLPGQDELRGQLVGVLSGPARGLAIVLSGAQRNLVWVLQGIAEQKA